MKKILFAIPAFNESDCIKNNINKLHKFLSSNVTKYNWDIIISNNYSEDETLEQIISLSNKLSNVEYINRKNKSISQSIQEMWLSKDADIYMFMDADLSTDISFIPIFLRHIESNADIVSGSRTDPSSDTARLFNRHVFSIILIKLIKLIFNSPINDFQCGFKAINKKIRNEIIPRMKCTKYGLISTEMLLVAESCGYKIDTIPVGWHDVRKSRIKIFRSAIDALWSLIKIKIYLIMNIYKPVK